MWLHDLTHHSDTYGLPVQSDGDGGDSLQKAGLWAIGVEFRKVCRPQDRIDNFSYSALARCHIGGGIWIRHPKAETFWSDPNLTTRDQLLNAFVICYQTKARKVWLKTFLRLVLRMGFSQNSRSTDGSRRVPDFMHLWLDVPIRTGGLMTWPLRPLLLVTDAIWLLQELIEALPLTWSHEQRRFRGKTKNDADADNFVLRAALAQLETPTPFSWLARKARAQLQNETFGQKPWMLSRVTGALEWKHRSDSGADPRMAELLRPFTEEYLSRWL